MVTAQKEAVKADILVAGGGPAGLMAAIRAAELGAKVVVADKSNTLRSGSGSGGNDHFKCYNPEFHGTDRKPIAEAVMGAVTGAMRDPARVEIWLDRSFEMVKLWESWGIPMKYKGKWDFGGQSLPGRPRIHMHYSGGNQKQVLTEQTLKRGAEIINRVTVFELLRDMDRVIGALGFDTWNDRVIQFEAKSVFLGTGGCCRLYPSSTPGWMFNVPMSPFNTGDGRAMALRAGAYLVGLEFAGHWAGAKYFTRAGKGTWVGVFRDPSGKPVGPFVTKPDIHLGDPAGSVYTTMFKDYAKSGRGPVYMDCHGLSKKDLEYMLHWLRNEGNTGLLDFMEKEGIDPTKNPIEFTTYEKQLRGGVWFNNASETNVRGLYASGDEGDMGMCNAAIWGYIAGENMAKYVKTVDFVGLKSAKGFFEEKVSQINAMRNRQEGAGWKEANIALQQKMYDYTAEVRSETMLNQGLLNLTRLREKANNTLMARNGHELGRCLEVLNLMDVGEAVMFAAKEREETRSTHKRTDYPFTNPLLNKNCMIRKEDGQLVCDWKGKLL